MVEFAGFSEDARMVTLKGIIGGIAGKGRIATAFSGGVDSSLLLFAAVQALGPERVLALSASSPTCPSEDLEDARLFAAGLGCEHRVLQTGECVDPDFLRNSGERCYVCKRIRYALLKRVAESADCVAVLDGTQADDDPGDRPGFRALTELGIAVPLREAGLGKAAVRELLAIAGFPRVAEKEAHACLATRIPVGVPITEEALQRVRVGEASLRELGLSPVRLRDHHPLARIVLDPKGMRRLFAHALMREEIIRRLEVIGYSFVTLDLRPYR